MSVSLRELRERQVYDPASFGEMRGKALTRDEFVALVEIAEAAHRANVRVPCGECNQGDDCPNARLEQALSKVLFDA